MKNGGVNMNATMSYRMSSKDEFYGGGIVNGSRGITLMVDVAERLVNKLFGNSGTCIEVETVRLHAPIYAGDYMEFIARVVDKKDDVVKIECRSFKIAAIPEKPEFPSSIDVLEDPTISTSATMIFKSKNN